MECPWCNKNIYAMTGLQELQKFRRHSAKCKKNPQHTLAITKNGGLVKVSRPINILEALDSRAKSGQ